MGFNDLLNNIIKVGVINTPQVIETLASSKPSVVAILSSSRRHGTHNFHLLPAPAFGLYISPLFAGPNYFVWSKKTRQTKNDIQVGYDSTISLDSNLAQAIETHMSARKIIDLDLKRMQALLDAKQALRSNIDWILFLSENLPHLHTKKGEVRVRNTIAAIKSFDQFGAQAFKLTGQQRRAHLELMLPAAIEDLNSFKKDTFFRESAHDSKFAQVILLKAFEIKLTIKKDCARTHLSLLIDFVLCNLKRFPSFEIRACWEYFSKAPDFFDAFQKGSKKWKSSARSMAWDLVLKRKLETIGTSPGRGDVMIPFLASTDRRFSQLLKQLPTQLLIFDTENGRCHSVAPDELDFQGVLGGTTSAFAKAELAPARASERCKSTVTSDDLTALIAELEKRIVKALDTVKS